MNEAHRKHAGRMIRRSLRCGIVAGFFVGLLIGCEGGASSDADDQSPESADVTPRHLPALTFPAEVRARHPEVSAFIDEFLGMWLVRDYAGYRRLVSRGCTPESRERFEAIYNATKAVAIESIEPISTPRLPSPAYRVVCKVELTPEQEARMRSKHRKVAILVFKELGNWRMAPAPAEYQPADEPPPATSSTPTTSAPSYPWDEEGDY